MSADSAVRNLAPQAHAKAHKVAFASFIGTAIEWYDFFIYGAAAALVFGPQFFPTASPETALLAAFATFGVGFAARPLGGVVMGHFGDRIGRKSMLVLSLVVMGCATFAIGLLPTYHQIGVWAPVLLVVLRFVQGLAVGGEWAGAVLMAVEHAPPGKRGLYGSFPQMGAPAGTILSNLAFLTLTTTLTPAQFQSWGWRVPFLLSAVLVVIGLLVRLQVTESPYFDQVKETGSSSRRPFVEVLRSHTKQVLLAGGSFLAINATTYLFLVYALSYGTTVVGMDRSLMLSLLLAAAAVSLVSTCLFSVLSDRVGRRKVFLTGLVMIGLWSLAFFPLINTGSAPLVLLALAGMAIAIAVAYGPQAALVSELFPTHLRYTGASLGYQIGSVLGGGLAPFIAAALYAATGGSTAITAYMGLACLVSLACALALAETGSRDLAGQDKPTAHAVAVESTVPTA